ncbi:MAG: hypothetical protein ACP5VQ_07195 [Phycisphaerae bacterium]
MVLLLPSQDAAEVWVKNIAFFVLFSPTQQNWDEHGGFIAQYPV